MLRRALVVDDEPAVCEFIQGILCSTGAEVLTLTTGLEAQVYLREEKFTWLCWIYGWRSLTELS